MTVTPTLRPGGAARRLVAVAALTALLALLLPSGRAHACSCIMIDAESRLAEAPAAFVGTLAERSGPAAETRFTFDVEAVLAGDLGPTVTVVGPEGDGANCGLMAQPGERLGLFLHGTPEGWSSSSCDTVDAEMLMAAGDPREPDPTLATEQTGAEDPGESSGPGWLAVGATAAVAVAALGGVVAVARRREGAAG